MSLSVAVGLQAQSPKKLSLQEALDLGVANSKQLSLSESKLSEAQAKVSEARDRIWPDLSVSATYLRINTPNFSLSDNVTNSGSGSGSGSSPLAAFANLHSLGLAQVTLAEPIFAGFKTRNTRLMSEYLQQAAQYDVLTAKSKVKLNTAKAFYQYYELLQTRGVVQENLKQEQQHVTEFKNLEAQKLLARNDRLEAELLVSNEELTLTEVNNNVKLAEYNLTILLGLPSETTFEIDTTGMFTTPALSTWDQYLQQGLESRHDLKSAHYQVQAGQSNYKIAQGDKLPTLALSAGFINAYIPNIVTVTNALNAGLSFKYNITGAIHAGHTMREAQARYQQAETSQKILVDQASIEIKQDYLKYQEQLEKLAITNRAIEQAQENFQITQNKYNQGLVIMSDYLDANVLLLQAQINHTTAKAESMIAYYELQESTGNLQ